MGEAILLLVSCADREEAARIGRALVEQRLAACVHVRPHEAIYRWQGGIETAEEYTLLVKTTAARAAQAEGCIRQLHSYDLPALFRLAASVDSPVLAWLDEATSN